MQNKKILYFLRLFAARNSKFDLKSDWGEKKEREEKMEIKKFHAIIGKISAGYFLLTDIPNNMGFARAKNS